MQYDPPLRFTVWYSTARNLGYKQTLANRAIFLQQHLNKGTASSFLISSVLLLKQRRAVGIATCNNTPLSYPYE